MQQYLSIPENRAAVRSISQRVLVEVDPDSAEIAAGFIEPLIDLAAQGKVVTGETSDVEGGFGGAELLDVLIVPTVVGVLSSLLTKLSETSLAELKKKFGRHKQLQNASPEDIEQMLIGLMSSNDKKKIKKKKLKKLAKAIHAAILEYLESDE